MKTEQEFEILVNGEPLSQPTIISADSSDRAIYKWIAVQAGRSIPYNITARAVRAGYVEKWQKDGQWHIAKRYYPTDADRRQFPISYPPGSDGPFYSWTDEVFDTESAATAALKRISK